MTSPVRPLADGRGDEVAAGATTPAVARAHSVLIVSDNVEEAW
jgi:hypothetical protein